jgi:hypothetical protein
MYWGSYINMIESKWHNVEASLNPYKRLGDYIHQFNYMFVACCTGGNVDHFTKFTTNMDCNICALSIRALTPYQFVHAIKQADTHHR